MPTSPVSPRSTASGSAPLGTLGLAELRAHGHTWYRRGGGSRPDVMALSLDAEHAVLKDHNRCDRWFALCLGPVLAGREAKALRRLDGVPGVPALLARVDRRALLIEHIDGRTLTALGSDSGVPWADIFARLEGVVSAMHARGVAHCDLRSPSNTLVDRDGQPWLVDFVASVIDGGRFNPLWRWLFRRFRVADRSAVAKLKRRFAPELLTEEDRQLLDGEGTLAWCARRVGAGVRIAARAVFTGSQRGR